MHSSKFSSVALRRETREESRQKNDTKFTSLIITTSYVERQNVLIPQGVLKVYESRNWIGNTSRIKESRNYWITITQLAQNKETWPGFVDALCSSKDHGVKYELKLKTAQILAHNDL